jgi:hypothetical protein
LYLLLKENPNLIPSLILATTDHLMPDQEREALTDEMVKATMEAENAYHAKINLRRREQSLEIFGHAGAAIAGCVPVQEDRVRDMLLAALAARENPLEEPQPKGELLAAFIRGFACSAEGFNGEYPFDGDAEEIATNESLAATFSEFFAAREEPQGPPEAPDLENRRGLELGGLLVRAERAEKRVAELESAARENTERPEEGAREWTLTGTHDRGYPQPQTYGGHLKPGESVRVREILRDTEQPGIRHLLREIVMEAEHAMCLPSSPDGWADTPLGRLLHDAEVIVMRDPEQGHER